LHPGLYAVTFTHPAFKTLRLEDVEVSGSRTVVVGAEFAGTSVITPRLLRIGADVSF
jgi:hypothetical protein